MKLLIASLFFPLLLSVSPAHAGEAQQSILAASNVVSSCFLSNVRDISFGNYDPVGANATTPITARNGASRVTCTAGTTAFIQVDQGQHAEADSTCDAPHRNMINTKGDKLSYELKQNNNTTLYGCSTSTQVKFTSSGSAPFGIGAYGTLPAGQNAPVGTYADTVTFRVLF